MIQGGLGVAASGNINPQGVSMFEPIHGSAPRHAGKNTACPIAAIAAVGMMLSHLGEHEAASCIEEAIAGTLASGAIKDLSAGAGLSTESTSSSPSTSSPKSPFWGPQGAWKGAKIAPRQNQIGRMVVLYCEREGGWVVRPGGWESQTRLLTLSLPFFII
jgi:hypothetical protein